TVMEYRKQGSKQVYYELVDEIPKEAIPREKKPDDPLYRIFGMDFIKAPVKWSAILSEPWRRFQRWHI
ncbi:hypothetical protein ABER65_14950, partial [Heyndrickxia faecalis]